MKIKFSLFIGHIILSLFIVECVIISSVDDNIYDKILENYLDKSKKELFKVYHFLYNKEYDLNSQEALVRYKIFKKNLKLIKETNEKNLPHKLGLGPFTDTSDDEFISNHLSNPKGRLLSLPNSIEFNSKLMKQYIPGSLSINYKSYFREPIDQGKCISNWAFSVIDSIESNYSLKYGKKIKLSSQELIDCDIMGNGCEYGDPLYAFEYIKNYGISNEIDYPLSSDNIIKNECKSNNFFKNFIIDYYELCYPNCNIDKIISFLQRGPVNTYIDAQHNNILRNYKSGILNLDCVSRNHYVTIIGIGTDKIEGDYFICRNTWGYKWGENGYFRIKINNKGHTCFIDYYGVLPRIIDIAPEEFCIKIYPECNMKGKHINACESILDLKEPPNSIYLPEYSQIIVFIETECRGIAYSIISNETCLKSNETFKFNKIKSVAINPITNSDCFRIYEGPCLNGKFFEMCTSMEDISANIKNFNISSIILNQKIELISLHSEVGYKGKVYLNNKPNRKLFYNIKQEITFDIKSIKIK